MVCRCRLGLRKTPSLPSRCSRHHSWRARIPAQWRGFGRAGRLASLDGERGKYGRRGNRSTARTCRRCADRSGVRRVCNQSQTTRPLTRPVQCRGCQGRSPRRLCAGRWPRTDPRLFRRLQVADPRLIELRAWSRLAEELRAERVRLSNRVHHQLWRYYPQMLKLTNDLAAPWFLELWAIASTPAKAGRLRKSTVERLLKQHRIRRLDAETVLRILREPAIKVAEGVAEAASIHMRSLVARLGVVNRELREAERKLDELCTAVSEIEQTSGEGLQRRDVAILRSVPGIGRINLATLLSEASGPLSRRDYEGLRTLSGAAPVTKRSGKSLVVVRRYAAHVRLRDTVYPCARVATQRDPKCRTRYTALRKRGHSHGRALRGVADRLLALACVLLHRQTLFDPYFGRPTS